MVQKEVKSKINIMKSRAMMEFSVARFSAGSERPVTEMIPGYRWAQFMRFKEMPNRAVYSLYVVITRFAQSVVTVWK